METYRAAESEVAAYRDRTPAEAAPRLSVVVPVYENPEGVRRTVESVVERPYPEIDLHVVYTPGSGETRSVLEQLSETEDALTVHAETEFEAPGAARNVGIDAATGDVVQFLDAGMTPGPDLLWRLAYLFDETDVDYLGLRVEMVGSDPDTLAGRYDELTRFPNERLLEWHGFCPTCGLAVRDRVFADGHRFNPTLTSGEDLVFGHEVSWSGYAIGFAPDCAVTHPIRQSLREIVAKGWKTGVGYHEIYHQYDVVHLLDRSLLLKPWAYRPPKRASVAAKCRGWESLPRREKLLVYLLDYVEGLSSTAGYAASIVGDSNTSRPALVDELYETVVQVPDRP